VPELSLSVILPALGGVDAASRTLACLGRQTRSDFEVVLVTPDGAHPDSPDLRIRPVAVDTRLAAEAYVAGIVRARGRVVALAEDHAFPAEDWIERLLAAHEGRWAAVGPAIENANPRSVVSRADLVLNFLDWIEPETGPAPSLAPHNTSYDRDALLEHAGEDLARAMASERLLHYRMEPHGLYVDADARVAHVNMSLWGPFLHHKFLGGWIFGGLRAEGWSFPKRATHALASPLVPLVRWKRILAKLLRTRAPRRHLAAAPAITLGLLVHAAGECLGYLTGPRAARERYRGYTTFETRRWELIRESDRRELRRG